VFTATEQAHSETSPGKEAHPPGINTKSLRGAGEAAWLNDQITSGILQYGYFYFYHYQFKNLS